MAERGNGRDDAAIVEALGMLAGVLGGNQLGAGIGVDRQLGNFQRNNPPLFKGTHDPKGAQRWLKEIKRIFRVIYCAEELKVCWQRKLMIGGLLLGQRWNKVVLH